MAYQPFRSQPSPNPSVRFVPSTVAIRRVIGPYRDASMLSIPPLQRGLPPVDPPDALHRSTDAAAGAARTVRP
jgi:hypothetical protein